MTAEPSAKPATRLDKLRAAVASLDAARKAIQALPCPREEWRTQIRNDEALAEVRQWVVRWLRAEELRRAER